jgi:hypothetical protein
MMPTREMLISIKMIVKFFFKNEWFCLHEYRPCLNGANLLNNYPSD